MSISHLFCLFNADCLKKTLQASLLALKVLSVKQNFRGSTEECGQRGLSECYFYINSALRFAVGAMAEIDHLAPPNYC